MKNDIRKSYYAVIPANVRYDERLTANAKLLYGEITALCNSEGYCWAENKYFADLYGVSKKSVSKWISNLCECGYIQSNVTYKQGLKEVDKRYITIAQPMEEKVDTLWKKSSVPIEENFHTYGRNVPYPMEEKVKDNNTINNTTNNTVNIDTIVSMYNQICVDLPGVIKTSNSRKQSVRNMLRKYSVEQFETVFRKAENSDFLTGKTKSKGHENFKASFDWLIKESNFLKTIEGNYDNKKGVENVRDTEDEEILRNAYGDF